MSTFPLPKIAALILFCFGPAIVATPALSPERFQEADNLFKDRNSEAPAKRALELYRKAHKRNKKDVEAGWRFAMACYFVGLRYLANSDARRDLYAEGRDAGLLAIKEDPKCAACYFWTSINMALYGQETGPFKMFFSLGEIKDYLKKSIEVDPTYAYAGAYRLLGQIEQGLPGLLGGSNDRAKEYYETAIKTVPDEPLNYLFLANLLHDKFDKTAEALKVVQRALSQKTPANDRVESLDALEAIKVLQKKLETELAKQR